jgi:YbbR domain-containing protein
MSWLVGNWRLKLLALVLAVALLAAVAFSENPPAIQNVSVGVSYLNVPPNLVVVNPPTSVKVTVAGLNDAVRQFSQQTSVGATVDLTHAQAGAGKFYAKVNPGTSGVTVESTTVPLQLDIDKLQTKQLDIAVRVTSVDPSMGISVVSQRTYATCGNDAEPCKVTVTGPDGVLSNLSAYVRYDARITAAGIERAPSLPVRFEQNGHPIDLSTIHAQPEKMAWAPNVVTARVETQGGILTKVVAVSVLPSGQPACGYRIDGLTINPNPFATISGPTDLVSRLHALYVDPVNISGSTSTQTFSRTLQSGSPLVKVIDPASGTIQVTVSVAQAFSCTANPPASPNPITSPKPSPAPSPSPS